MTHSASVLSRLFLCLLFAFLVLGCADTTPPPKPPQVTVPKPVPTEIPVVENIPNIPVPPWRLYRETSGGEFSTIDDQVRLGKIDLALADAERLLRAPNFKDNEDLFARLISLKLQFGRSKEVLSDISRFASERGIRTEELSPQLCLLAAYAYKHEHDIDQTLAWLGLSIRRGAGTQAAFVASKEAEALLYRINDQALGEYAAKWDLDQTIRPFFGAELKRRYRGGSPIKVEEIDYYSSTTYGIPEIAPPVAQVNQISQIAVITLYEGKFAKQGEQLRRGIELAQAEIDPTGELGIEFLHEGNSDADPIGLGALEDIYAVLGPQQSSLLKGVRGSILVTVPIFSFSKGDDVSGVSDLYPLNISAAQEGESLLEFSRIGLGAKHPIILVPPKFPPDQLSKLMKLTTRVVTVVPNDDPSAIIASSDAVLALLTFEDYEPLLEKLRTTNPNIPVVGGSGFNDRVALRSYVAVAEGMYFLVPFYPDSERPVVQNFINSYRQKYQDSPGISAAIGYDGARLILNRLKAGKQALEASKTSLVQELSKTSDFQSVTGIVSFSETEGFKRRFNVIQVKGGEFVERGIAYETVR